MTELRWREPELPQALVLVAIRERWVAAYKWSVGRRF